MTPSCITYRFRNNFSFKISSGFLGKVLIEKLLRDCTDLSVVYILIRSKKGINPEDRLNNYINHVGKKKTDINH